MSFTRSWHTCCGSGILLRGIEDAVTRSLTTDVWLSWLGEDTAAQLWEDGIILNGNKALNQYLLSPVQLTIIFEPKHGCQIRYDALGFEFNFR